MLVNKIHKSRNASGKKGWEKVGALCVSIMLNFVKKDLKQI